ncbi:MAG: hypothetical protein HY543_07885 [Deltaproteobacteria bacterium]|nr:hypothetical protein [Deltaproteobacteria bacterium]
MARTTVTLADPLLARLRECAAKQGRTIADTLNEILAQHFRPKRRSVAYRFHWKVVAGRREPAIDPADRDRLIDFLERSS